MIDQTLIQSGFDSEVVFGSRYIQYLLLNSIETGSLEPNMLIPVETDTGNTTLDIKLYLPADYERVYAPNPLATISDKIDDRSFQTEILFNDPGGADLKVTMIADIHDTASGQGMDAAEIQLFTTFQLALDEDANGNQSNARMKIELLDVEGLIIDLAVALFGITKDEIIANMKPEFDREVELGIVGPNQNVQTIEMQKLAGDVNHPHGIGIYVNLKLKDGPEPDSFLPERGDLNDAVNFLDIGQDIAFGMPGSVYNKLGNDAFQKMAEETSEGSGQFIYPIHENPNDKDSDIKGEIFGISMYARDGNLVIDVSGEYYVPLLPNAGFNIYIYIKPSVTSEGLIEWDWDYDLEISDVYKFLAAFLGVFLAILFGPGGLIAGGILTLAVVGGQELIVEPLALKMLEEEAEGMVDASFFDAIPARLTVETRRWDPFYKTHHQIVAKTDAVQITNLGIGFSGVAILDRQAEVLTNVVIRTEKKDSTLGIAELWYKVPGFNSNADDSINYFPGTDRMPYYKVEGDAESDLFALTLDACKERIPLGKLLPMIPYTAKKVEINHNQVDHIMVISNREIKDTPDQVNNLLRFDLPPEQMADLQMNRIMFLNGFVVIDRQGKLYYRDKADGNVSDNLMSLPRYKPTDLG